MADVHPVDRLEVLVLVDNVTDSLSTNPKDVISERSGLLSGGRLRKISGENICCAHHGFSLLITTHCGSDKHTILFDAGPEGSTFLRNASILAVEFAEIEAIVLSHGHWDHAGGLLAAIDAISRVRLKESPVCYVHPSMFAQRASQRPNGELYVHERVPNPAVLTDAGATVVNTRDPEVAGSGAFYISGEIPRLTKYEAGLPGALRRSDKGDAWEPDSLIMDERFVLVHVKDKGMFVFTACSHAGLINVLNHARSTFPAIPLYGVVGGFHLSGVTEKIIPDTVGDLKQFGLKLLAPAHCTGWRALIAMAKTFGDELVPSAVGKRYLF